MDESQDAPSGQTPLGTLVGERLRGLRLEQGINLTDVARESGVSRRMLTLIEQGSANPSVLTLDRVAAALGTDVAHLVLRPEDPSLNDQAPAAFRSTDAVRLVALPSGGGAQLRARTNHKHGPELWTWVLQPGDTHNVDATAQSVEQLVLVTAGELHIVTDTGVLTLSSGDSAVVLSNLSHRYLNPGPTRCRFVQVSQSAAS